MRGQSEEYRRAEACASEEEDEEDEVSVGDGTGNVQRFYLACKNYCI